MKIRFFNATIVTVNDNFDVINNGELEVTDNVITYVGAIRNLQGVKFDKEINCENNILMPGLINTHSHAAMTLFRGMGDEVVFEEWWRNTMLPLEMKLTPADIERGVEIAVKEMLSNGITTFFDCYFMQESAIKVSNRLGIRMGVGFGAVTSKEVLTQESLKKEFELYNKYKNVIPFTYAHSIYSCDEYQFGELVKFTKDNNLVFSTHVSETLTEVGNCHNKHGVTPVGLLEDYGVLDIPCVFAHCVHCDKDDVTIMKNYGENVSIAHNPASNLKLGSGIAPLHTYLKNGLNVSLGTDGAASNNNLDMLKEMYLAGNLQYGLLNNPKAVTIKEIIKMATVNGAKAFRQEKLGVLKEGNLADIIMLDTSLPNMQPNNNVLSNIVFSATNRNVVMTMVDGVVVYNNFLK